MSVATSLTSDRIKLPFSFNAEKMLEEFRAFRSEHFEYYDVIPLRAPAHQADTSLPFPPAADDYADGFWTECLDTKALRQSPNLTNVTFYVNNTPVMMLPDECWHLRLTDPHKIDNLGITERVKFTIDMIPNDWVLKTIIECEV